MKKTIFLVLFAVAVSAEVSAQVFKPTPAGLELYTDSTLTSPVGSAIYEQCWCNPVYSLEDTSLLYLVPKKNAKGYFSVSKGGQWGGIDASGATVRPFSFDGPFEERKSGHFNVFHHLKDTLGTLQYQLGSTITRVDSVGKPGTTYYVMDEYKGSYLVSANKEDFGIISADFKILLPMKYQSIHYTMTHFRFNPSGLLPLQNELDKCGVVNHQGKTVVSFSYDWMNDYIYNDDFIFVQNGKKRGFVNSTNQVVVPLKFEKLPYRLEDRNLVADENYTWFVDREFKAISPKYQVLEREGDVWFFKKDNKWGVMDADMKIVVPNIYSEIEYGPRLKSDPAFKCYYAVKNGRYGLISLTNEVIIPFEYECICGISYYAPDTYYIEFKKGTTLYHFDHTGKLVEKLTGEGKMCLCQMTTE